MELLIGTGGDAHAVYGEELDLTALGDVHIRRASHVEPDPDGRWWADLSPVGGPKLGPYLIRSTALEAELSWLRRHLAKAVRTFTLENVHEADPVARPAVHPAVRHGHSGPGLCGNSGEQARAVPVTQTEGG